jgi:dolichol kinase
MTFGLVVFFCAVTWFVTMFYYTDRYKMLLKNHSLVEVKCSHCSIRFVVSQDNLRNPMYCSKCK